MSTPIVIRIAGVDITTDVLFATASFEAQMGAIPGTWELTVKDVARTYSFVTGDEMTLDLGGTRLVGGYTTQVSEKFALPVVDTRVIANVSARQWVLRGVDYNILFDKRVLRNTSNYLGHLATYAAGSLSGVVLRAHLADYIDVPSGFNITTDVEDGVSNNPDSTGAWMQQGTVWRKQMEDFAQWGAVYYLNAAKHLIFKSVEDTQAPWQFSDRPNRLPIPADHSYKPTIGFREGEFVEDGTLIVNDALVWGGGNYPGRIFFARRENAASIANHGRWQLAETHFNELKTQRQVNERARVIVDGTVTGDSPHGTRGLVNPQQTVRLTWFDRDVPDDPATSNPAFLRPGDVVTFIMYTLGVDASHPLVFDLPLRSLKISFPGLDPSGLPYVQFTGYFGLQLSDPWWLWKYIRDNRQPIASIVGSSQPFVPTPAPNGSATVFTIPPYVIGTTELYKNGLRNFSPANYTESDSLAGEITISPAPVSGDQLYVIATLIDA